MYSFLDQDEDDKNSLLDMFKSENLSIPELPIITENVIANQNYMETPKYVELSDDKADFEEEKSLSKMERKRKQGKLRAKKSRDRK